MDKVITLLLMISVAIYAYTKARQMGTWSWLLFVKTILWLSALGVVSGVLGVWLGRIMGPEHALLATLLSLAVIVAGVVVLHLWMFNKNGRNKR
jgi:hypothetical protein